MGSPKALLDFRGAPFVVRILEVLEVLEVRPRIVVVGPGDSGARAALAGRECVVVENSDVDGGPIASLRGPAKPSAPCSPRALAWPVDLPRPPDDRRAPARHPSAGPPRRGRAAFGERRGAGLWDVAVRGLRNSAPRRDGGGRVCRRTRPPSYRPVDDPAVVDSLNTPEDYQRLVRSVNRDIY
jgi:CTP:molybdopterin cytidylyltransferase MocA